ncbi:MAG TPA: SpoIVB peptidase S55 domain-containing protein [Gemmatales bacterium]|nr:SpoIVB peptidase S55 domain-containing protein [Gemmatales bacterium]
MSARTLALWGGLALAAAWLTCDPLASLPPLRAPLVWNVDQLQVGQKGYGLSVFQGTRIERFDVEILGVLKNTSPGRDMVLARCSGCGLEKTGVIAGMSGSPVYVDGKLVGALAYAWPFGTEPIAGITPFTQMEEYADLGVQRPVAAASTRRQVLPRPVRVGDRLHAEVEIQAAWPLDGAPEEATVRPGKTASSSPAAAPSLTLVPLQTPLALSGFSPRLHPFLSEQLGPTFALMPMGGVAAALKERHALEPLRPGSPLATALVQGDFDMSGIGTVTEVRGERVWGWGHPFMSLGRCDLPLLYGYVHTVLPRQTVSFKMGSPLRPIGTLEADVSTGIAGRLGKSPDLLPVEVTVARPGSGRSRTFHCQVVRHRQLLPQLVHAVLSNSVDTDGECPEELTVDMETRIDLPGRPALVVRDSFSGRAYSGSRAPISLFSQVAALLHGLCGNPFEEIQPERVSCHLRLYDRRTSAEIEGAVLLTETLAPGETLRVAAWVKPFQRPAERVIVELALPEELPEGSYTAVVCDDLVHHRSLVRETPALTEPADIEQWLAVLRLQAGVQRNLVVLRVLAPESGVVLSGQTLPQLPGSMVDVLANSRRTGVVQVQQAALSARSATSWMVQGSHSLRFTVDRKARVQRPSE